MLRIYAEHITLLEWIATEEGEQLVPLGTAAQSTIQKIIMELRDEMLQVRSLWEQTIKAAAQGQPLPGRVGLSPGEQRFIEAIRAVDRGAES